MLQKDEECSLILGAGGGDWEIYLHPSQTFLVELQRSFRAAVVGSAGTGKTICAWHRAKHLIEAVFRLALSAQMNLSSVSPRNVF